MTTNTSMPGDINVTSIQLFNFAKSYSQEISAQINTIEIYESIISPLIFAVFYVDDSINLHEKFPIKGEEWIQIKAQAPGVSRKNNFNYSLRIIQKVNLSTNAQGKSTQYKLIACSEEYQNNAKGIVSKTFNNTTITSMVSDIITNSQFLNSKKKISTAGGETRGGQTLTIPNFSPLKAIDFLRQRAVSEKYKTSIFVFFETREQFNFTTLEYLFENGRSNSRNPIFFFNTALNRDIKLSDVEQARNIISYKHIVSGDPIISANRGGFRNEVINHDLRTATVTRVTTTKSDVSSASNYGDKKVSHTSGAITNDLENPFGTDKVLFFTNSRKPQTYREISIGANKVYSEQFMQNIVRILVAGDTSIQAGQMVNIELPEFKGTTEDGNTSRKSKYTSGNYIVTKLRHTIYNQGRWQHRLVMECEKGAFGNG